MNPKVFTQILEIAFQKKVSDIHFEVDNPPFFRIHGQLVRSKLPNLMAQDTEAIVGLILKNNELAPGGVDQGTRHLLRAARRAPGASASASSASGASSAS